MHLVRRLGEEEVPQVRVLVVKVGVKGGAGSVEGGDAAREVPAVFGLGGGDAADPDGPEVRRVEVEYGPGAGECAAGETEYCGGVAGCGSDL